MKLGGRAGDAARQNLASVSDETPQQIGILVIDPDQFIGLEVALFPPAETPHKTAPGATSLRPSALRPTALRASRSRTATAARSTRTRTLVAALPRAARERICTLISDHRSLGRTCRFDGGATSDHLILFPEQEYRIHDFERWMLRITDVPAALTARGWPSHADAELHLQVTDDVVPENDGRWLLRVSGGEASVETGGEGSLKLSVGMLAPLYTGLHSASTLAELGRLEGSAAAIATADEAFAGPEPVMTERF